MGYRPRESYISKDPEKRKRQLSGLRQYQAKAKHEAAKGYKPPLDCSAKALQKLNIIEFANRYLHISFRERPAHGLPLTVIEVDEFKIYSKLTHRPEVCRDYEKIEKKEGCWCLGRRSGKSWLVAVITLYESICRAHIHRKGVRENQIIYAVLIAVKYLQSIEIIQSYCAEILASSKLSFYIKDSNLGRLLLKNNMCIQSFPCNTKAGRGYPVYLLVADECGHYFVEGARADVEVYNALYAGTAQFPEAKSLLISTPAGKSGLFWERFNQGFEVKQPYPRLTIQAPTWLINPVIENSFFEGEKQRDIDNYEREYKAEFAEVAEGFFSSCMDQLLGCFEFAEDLPFDRSNHYFAGMDASGLSGRDRWGLAISHDDFRTKRHIVDCVRAWDTKNLDVIVNEIMFLLSNYKISTLFVDHYALGFIASIFKKRGVEVIVADKLAACYINFKTLVRGDRLMLPDNPGLRNGLVRTEAFYSKGQNLTISHMRSSEGHGDLADACVRSVYAASQNLSTVSFTPLEDAVAAARAAERRKSYNPLTFHRDRRSYVL